MHIDPELAQLQMGDNNWLRDGDQETDTTIYVSGTGDHMLAPIITKLVTIIQHKYKDVNQETSIDAVMGWERQRLFQEQVTTCWH